MTRLSVVVARSVVSVCLVALSGLGQTACAFELPAAWRDVGPVAKWMEIDGHFMRIEGLTGSPGPQAFSFEQKSIYAKTKVSTAALPTVDLAEFLALDTETQERRHQVARDEIVQVRRFRLRMSDLVMRVQRQVDVAWGVRPSDMRAVGDLMGKLQTAVSVDPSNAFAWHLLSFFAANTGDLHRALDALDGCDAALAVLPDTVLTDTRLRAELDRAWVLRDLGFFEQAGEALDRMSDPGKMGREVLLVRGLIAAQSGDMNRAFGIAAALQKWDLPVFQLDWEALQFHPGVLDPMAWGAKPSDYIKNWILALAWLHEGNVRQAAKAFPEYSLDRHYELGRHFINEAAQIYEATGRPGLATKFWAMADLYVPFQPYLVYKAYGMKLTAVTGRAANIPFVLGFDSCLQSGSRLAFGMALVSQALALDDRQEQIVVAEHAIDELAVCLRSGISTVAAALAMGYAQAVGGNPYEMMQAADQGLTALSQPGVDQTFRPALEKLRRVALAGQKSALLGPDAGWGDETASGLAPESLAERSARLQAAYEDNRAAGEARRQWARFQIRYGDVATGARLAELPFTDQGQATLADWILLLELDRLRNNTTDAVHLLQLLKEGRGPEWPSARLWTLVGIICQDNGVAGARRALEFALFLDPDNIPLQEHLQAIKS